jgi:hypothetical protein
MGGQTNNTLGSTTNYGLSIFTSLINTDGTLSKWQYVSSISNVVSPVTSHSNVLVTNSKIYILGSGRNDIVKTATNSTIYVSNIDQSDLSRLEMDWTIYGTIPADLVSFNMLLINKTVYLMGGIDTPKIYKAEISDAGILGGFTQIILDTTYLDNGIERPTTNLAYNFIGGLLTTSKYLYLLGTGIRKTVAGVAVDGNLYKTTLNLLRINLDCNLDDNTNYLDSNIEETLLPRVYEQNSKTRLKLYKKL